MQDERHGGWLACAPPSRTPQSAHAAPCTRTAIPVQSSRHTNVAMLQHRSRHSSFRSDMRRHPRVAQDLASQSQRHGKAEAKQRPSILETLRSARPVPAKPLRVEGREERINLRAGPRLLRCTQAVQVAHGGECLPELVQTELPVAVPAARPKQRTARDSDTRRDRYSYPQCTPGCPGVSASQSNQRRVQCRTPRQGGSS